MTLRALARCWPRLRRDDRGVAAVEFALLVPIAIIVLGLLIWATKQEWPRLRPPFSSRN